MQETLNSLNGLRRPRLLIRAARIGASHYNRDMCLRGHFGYGALPRSTQALSRLVDMEAALEDQRRIKGAGYSVSRHVNVLIAMMGEARILRAALAA
ncbi:hypothetical protein KUD11_12270 [Roseovarius sp. LXJ103]|uniref:DUF6477 family protein n=1 Tax=Roseovarius carneus TaxID=2853164 RepID=UPI000D620CB5|nr:DUF6477 family protein [Roseovarius carneus]MBZ8119417.1 hypothetical protein [Roseovarius carneus]PWE34940.1 hypothetical protein DD563_02485 [Pelagicola sp. LXJ1103]